MREIKFRAWEPVNFTMLDVVSLNIELKTMRSQYDEDHELHNIELMQYTGLKDKNGVEIYEGDIVNIFGSSTEIEFYEGSFGYWIWKEKKYRNFITATISDKEEIEVIGNIYENKELL